MHEHRAHLRWDTCRIARTEVGKLHLSRHPASSPASSYSYLVAARVWENWEWETVARRLRSPVRHPQSAAPANSAPMDEPLNGPTIDPEMSTNERLPI
ncbi:hypothetical protein [Trinickia dinghuensis]|uniref:hypothetical protein n=1 Tax=Trinickia dinghuensis TaxID=2291023 RepID=UPI0011C07DED|nr:hypothetical protein [Trinickia dinghuensis]